MLVGEVFARMGLDSRQYEKDLDKLEGKTQKKAMTLGSIFKGAFSFALGMGLISGFRSLGGAITDFVNTAARTEVLDVAMQSVAKSSGYAIAALREQRKSVMELGIAEQEATQILTRFMQAQLDTADAAKLARVAQDAAVIAGYNSSQAAEQMTEAIAKQRPELLSAFGMTRNMNEIYKDYAGTVGKTAAQLSEAEKKQAMLNYILKEGEKIAGTYEASMGAVGKQIGSLPRYWDTLKNAIARPLALPAISVIVDGLTNGLKNAIGWAEANTMTLQRWGQTAANVASYVVKGFQVVTRTFAENWGMIRFAATALITYAVATRTAAGATALLQTATVLLNGNMAAQAGLLGFVSNVVTYYKVQMLGAAATSNIFTAALMRVRVALIAVNTALGPIGWAVLAITGLVTAGMALWNKYTQSLQKTPKVTTDMGDAAADTSDQLRDQADAMADAGKAANKNLQSFDEVHQLQEDMAGSGADMLDAFGMDPLDTDIPGLDMGDMLAGIEEDIERAKPTLKGFWDWIKQGAGNLWDGVKQKWSDFVNWVKAAWNGVANVISSAWAGIANITQTVWQEVWNLLQTYWNNAVKLATDVFGAIWGFVKGTWDNIRNTTFSIWSAIWDSLKNQWETIKTFAINIFGTVRDLILGKIDLRTAVQQIWGEIKNFFFSSWSNIRDFGISIWDTLQNFFLNQWLLIQGFAIAIWTAIKDFFVGNWEATKEAASNIWTAIKDFFSQTWEAIETAVVEYWNTILSFLGTNWEIIKQRASEIWQSIRETITNLTANARDRVIDIWSRTKDRLLELWEGIKQGAREKWDGVRTVIKGAVNGIIGFINKFIRGWNKIELKVPSINIPLLGTVGGWSVRVPQIPEIPMLAKGGLVTAPTLAMLGEAGPEAVIPLGRSGFAGDLADTVAQAVYQAIMDAIRIAQASSQQSDDRELVLKIDNTTLARMQLPAIIREGQRQGLNLVVRPQGV